jgi:hypothetical protein
MRILRVELSLARVSERVKRVKGGMNGLCDMFVGEEELLLDCKIEWGVRGRHVR